MSATTTSPASRRPGLLDALSLLAEVADELVVRTVRDTHLAWPTGSTGSAAASPAPPVPRSAEVVHRGIAAAVYGGLGAGLRAASRGLDAVAASGVGPRLEAAPRGRFLSSAVNGLIGDRLVRERPRLAIPMAVRARRPRRPARPPRPGGGVPRAPERRSWSSCTACARTRSHWDRGRDEVGTTYGEALAERGWTPVFLRANTGLRAAARTASRWPPCCSAWSRRGRSRSPGSRWSATRWAGW